MKNIIISICLVAMVLALAPAPPAQATTSPCDALGDTRTNSFEQAWDYVECVFNNMAQAWELNYLYW